MTSELTILQRKATNAIPVPLTDWKKLKNSIRDISVDIKWWEFAMTTGFSHAITVLLTIVTTGEKEKFPEWIENSGWFGLAVGLCSMVFMITQKKRVIGTKEQVIQEMERLDDACIKSESDNSRKINVRNEAEWSTSQSNHTQGYSFKELSLSSALLKSLKLSISSSNDYWRAGVKLMCPNMEHNFAPRTDGSMLIHLHRTSDRLGLVIYKDKNSEAILNKDLGPYPSNKKIELLIEINERNFLLCYVNESLEYNERIDSEKRKKVLLCAWGDSNKYDLCFEDIEIT